MLWSVMRLIFKTSSVTPNFFYVFNIFLSFSTYCQSFKKTCTWELLGANVLKGRTNIFWRKEGLGNFQKRSCAAKTEKNLKKKSCKASHGEKSSKGFPLSKFCVLWDYETKKPYNSYVPKWTMQGTS